MNSIISFLSLIFLLFLSFSPNSLCEDNVDYVKKTGRCKGLWRPDKLIGRCFGLKPHNEYKELNKISSVNTQEECRHICCNMGNDCISWQYLNHTNNGICTLGGPVRLGLEANGKPDWCDPSPPGKWNGKRLLTRSKSEGCSWGEDLPDQCFGLGPERKSKGWEGEPLSEQDCSKACCEDSECEMWQQMDGRGCYFAKKEGVWCEEKPKGSYFGQRKCIPDYCGSKEEETRILEAFKTLHLHNKQSA